MLFHRHSSSRHPGDSASFLSFSGTDEYSNGLAGGNGAGNRALTGHGVGRGQSLAGSEKVIEPQVREGGWTRRYRVERTYNGRTVFDFE